MTQFKTLDDLGDVTGKVALVRVDLNVPMRDGDVTDDTRIRAFQPTVETLCEKGAKVLLLAHFGRPKGQKSSTQSLSMVVGEVEEVLLDGRRVGAPGLDHLQTNLVALL